MDGFDKGKLLLELVTTCGGLRAVARQVFASEPESNFSASVRDMMHKFLLGDAGIPAIDLSVASRVQIITHAKSLGFSEEDCKAKSVAQLKEMLGGKEEEPVKEAPKLPSKQLSLSVAKPAMKFKLPPRKV